MSLEEKKEFTFLWEIKNFSFCTQKKDEYLDSPVFLAESLHETSWYVTLYPLGEAASKEGFMACYLNRFENDDGPSVIECEYKFQLMTSEEKILSSYKSTGIFLKNDNWGSDNIWKQFKPLNNTHDVLKIQCILKAKNQKKSVMSESIGVTKIDIDQFSFKWNVKNLNSDCSEIIKFPYTGTPQVEILIQAPDDDVRISIRNVEEITDLLSMRIRITLLDLEGEAQNSRQDQHIFKEEESNTNNYSWVFPHFLSKSKLNSEKDRYLVNDCFTLRFEIAISNGNQTKLVELKTPGSHADEFSQPDRDIVNVLDDLKRLYKDKILSDVKLVVEGQIVQAHKNILSVRSPVFKAMFDTDMVESGKGSVNIPDLDAETVSSLLEYMYTGAVEKLDYEVTIKLIVAAEKYQVLSLKEKCARFLKSTMTNVNVCDILVIADLIQHEVLKAASVNHIKQNSECVFLSKEWNEVIRNNIQLATETVSKVSAFIANETKTANK